MTTYVTSTRQVYLEGCSAMAQAKRVCALTSIHKCMVSSEKKRSKPLSKAHTSRSSRTRTATHGEPSLLWPTRKRTSDEDKADPRK